jgi:hypothetical protein
MAMSGRKTITIKAPVMITSNKVAVWMDEKWMHDFFDYVEMVNECVNKHCFTLGAKHKKLMWILTAMCGAETQQFHPWIKPMKRVANKSLKKLMQIYPNWKESDLEVLDKIITDRELEDLIEAHGIDSK